MKAGLITVLLLVLAGNLSGCGQKGPLYRESPAQAASVKTPDAEKDPASDAEETRRSP